MPAEAGPGRDGGAAGARDAGLVAGLILFALVTRILFLYRGGTGDPDVIVMAAGMARSLAPGADFGEAMTYGRHISPGIYLVFRLVSSLWLREPSQVLPFLNGVGVASASLLAWPLYRIFRWHLSAAIAAGGVVLVLLTPLVWEAGTYFHPIVLASLLLGWAMMAGRRFERTVLGFALLALAVLLGAGALLMRAEVALAAPALLAGALSSRRPRRGAAVVGAVTILAALAYLAVVRILPARAGDPGGGLAGFVTGFAASYFRPEVVPRSLVWSLLALGIGTVALLLGLARPVPARSRRPVDRGKRTPLPAALLWIGVPYLFWLSNPVPLMRHYFLAVPALVWILGRLVEARVRPARWGVLLLLVVAANLLVPEGLYRGYNRARPHDPKTPHGSFFYLHAQRQQDVVRYLELRSRMGGAIHDGAAAILVQVDWEGYGYVLYGLTHEPGFDPRPADEALAAGLVVSGYRLDRGRVELLLTQDPPLEEHRRAVAARLEKALAAGEEVFVTEATRRWLGTGAPTGLRAY